ETAAPYGGIVWSWRRDPGVKPRGKSHVGDGGKTGRSPGRARISRKAIARGKPGCLGCTCQTRVRCCSFCTRCCGRSRRPAFPAPSIRRGPTRLQNPGESAPREREGLPENVHRLPSRGSSVREAAEACINWFASGSVNPPDRAISGPVKGVGPPSLTPCSISLTRQSRWDHDDRITMAETKGVPGPYPSLGKA